MFLQIQELLVTPVNVPVTPYFITSFLVSCILIRKTRGRSIRHDYTVARYPTLDFRLVNQAISAASAADVILCPTDPVFYKFHISGSEQARVFAAGIDLSTIG